MASALVLPHPERGAPEVRRLQPDPEVEQKAMDVVMAYESAQGRNPEDVHEKNLGYDIKSVDPRSGELRLIEVKGLGAVVTNCDATAELQEPVRDPARFPWHEVMKIQHYWLEVNAMNRPMGLREEQRPYQGGPEPH
jgi:hypothetical protein